MTHDELCALIPHTGTMCVLDEVVRWDDDGITCLATSHRSPENPLRNERELPAICAVEYAAQAMAVHGGLRSTDRKPPKVGYIAALRQILLHTDRLDDIDPPLTVEARREGGDDDAFMYSFSVSAEGRVLVEGTALVVHQKGEVR